MSGFSSRGEEVIERTVDVVVPTVRNSEDELVDKFDLHECVKWILDNNLEKVGESKHCISF